MRRQRERQWRKTPCAPGTVTVTLLLSGSEFAGLHLHLAHDAPLVCSVSSCCAHRFLVYLSVPIHCYSYTHIGVLNLFACSLCNLDMFPHENIYLYSNSCWMSFRWSSLSITLLLFCLFFLIILSFSPCAKTHFFFWCFWSVMIKHATKEHNFKIQRETEIGNGNFFFFTV